ncbi:hypothetical protein K2Z83_11300 [Oscillochloris sp. ZM17-4]|uniref:hypothetical protein n=1 Tax=Oscillochloris sp. ZM17-4 TaxID=2866714 RepID=UPI001C72FDCE|nr:hypothetical protein [Oscillochloris sp. ZM17-4]MBX0328262.1 hypothetical protein [Oscillochloris sp. ZM17-4]
MSDNYTFNDIPFVVVVPNSGETPHWQVKADATDRKLIGTDRFERSVRSRQWTMDCDIWVEPTDDPADALAYWEALQSAYGAATLALLVSPAGSASAAIILKFDVVPLRGGVDGYRGKVTFGVPGGRS